MQFTIVTVLLAALIAGASAVPHPSTCTFGQYECADPTLFNGVVQCGYASDKTLQKLKIGDCPTDTHCGYIADVPYCLAN
ncbi:hypothetical protein HYALB_00003889 [Hymenoscyphus albidus]|uniref:Uncharacterized protein n=1 Tax=Hymenoscyphus albidus TaxID=595503 RepID=A0A9N9LU47_9HELO|nr:hypothetical protein HYALB_00003889 [Hymenoscyphus albidus]